eukprot:1452396-Amphidinium_carterae.1
MAIQRSLLLRPVFPTAATSREDLLGQELKQAQQSTELQNTNHKTTRMKRLGTIKIRRFAFDSQQRMIAEAEGRHSQSVAGLQQNQAALVIGEANTSFTRLHEEYQSARQARSHLIGLIGSQQEGDQHVHTLQQALAEAQAELVNSQGREHVFHIEAGISQLGQERFRSEAQELR